MACWKSLTLIVTFMAFVGVPVRAQDLWIPELDYALQVFYEDPFQGPYCLDSLEMGDGQQEIPYDPKPKSHGIVEYRVAPVNTHQGPTLAADKLSKEILERDYQLDISPQLWEEMQKQFLTLPPEPPGIREGLIQLPDHVIITHVDYVCEGLYCGWCYNPDPANYGYLADIKILPNKDQGHRVRWKRMYTGREVNERYYISWVRVGPGPNPPRLMVQDKKSRPQKKRWSLSAKDILSLLRENQREQGGLIQGRLCHGSVDSGKLKGMIFGKKKFLESLSKWTNLCCGQWGGVKDIKSFPLSLKVKSLLNVQIECKREGEHLNLGIKN